MVLSPTNEAASARRPMPARCFRIILVVVRYEDLPRLMHMLTGGEAAEPETSTLDVLWVLYDRVLRISSMDGGTQRPDLTGWERDRFVLSKGHQPEPYYAVLAAKGLVPIEWLSGYGAAGSSLGTHPDRMLVPGVEFSSGSLGHGLPVAVGMAHGLRVRGHTDTRVVVLVGDAELDEGSNHEAIAYAASAGLGSLTAIVTDNDSATYRWPGGLENAFSGWRAETVHGRDHAALEKALGRAEPAGPNVVVATVWTEEEA